MSYIQAASTWTGFQQKPSSLNHGMRISSTGMTAEKFRMDVISANIANMHSVKINGKDPYRRRVVSLSGTDSGPAITNIIQDQSSFRVHYDPGNPLADPSGNVYYSNVEPLYEAMDMMNASRAYELNVAAFNTTKRMAQRALDIGKD